MASVCVHVCCLSIRVIDFLPQSCSGTHSAHSYSAKFNESISEVTKQIGGWVSIIGCILLI